MRTEFCADGKGSSQYMCHGIAIRTHCIIHQESLCGKYMEMWNVLGVVMKTVNYVLAVPASSAEMNAQYQEFLYYTEVRLS